MVKGFTDSNGKFRPTGQPLLKSNKEKSIDTSRGTLITEGTFEFIPRETGVTFETANKRFIEFRNETVEDEFSFDPELNQGFDFNNKEQAREFHETFVEGGDRNPVFVIGVQNQLGKNPTRATQSAYEDVKNDGRTPLIGGSINVITGQPQTDISFPISNVTREEALDLADEYAQDSIAIIFPDGKFRVEDVNPIEPFEVGKTESIPLEDLIAMQRQLKA